MRALLGQTDCRQARALPEVQTAELGHAIPWCGTTSETEADEGKEDREVKLLHILIAAIGAFGQTTERMLFGLSWGTRFRRF